MNINLSFDGNVKDSDAVIHGRLSQKEVAILEEGFDGSRGSQLFGIIFMSVMTGFFLLLSFAYKSPSALLVAVVFAGFIFVLLKKYLLLPKMIQIFREAHTILPPKYEISGDWTFFRSGRSASIMGFRVKGKLFMNSAYNSVGLKAYKGQCLMVTYSNLPDQHRTPLQIYADGVEIYNIINPEITAH